MSRYNEVGKHKTRIIKDTDGVIRVRYHNTDVVTITPDKSVMLFTGGYRSNTTKLRMNQASHKFDLGYSVYQRNYSWYVDFQGETIDFTSDHLILSRKESK